MEYVTYVPLSIGGFLNRQKKKIFFLGAFCGTVYFGGKYFVRRLIQAQEEQIQKQMDLAKKQQYFEGSMKTCDKLILGLLPKILEKLHKILYIPTTAELRGEKDPQKRLNLWNELTIKVFTRSVVALYCSNLLTVFLRIQVNLIGRYLNQRENNPEIDPKIQQNFFSYSEFLINHGIDILVESVLETTENILKKYPLEKQITPEDISDILWGIRAQLESEEFDKKTVKFLRFILPPEDSEQFKNLEKQEILLLNEFRNELESWQFLTVFRTCTDNSFLSLIDSLREPFVGNEGKINVMPLVKFPVHLKKQENYLLGTTESSLVALLIRLQELDDYSYYIFTKM